MKTCLSFGAGVQKTALLVLIANGELPRPDRIVFADTGTEHQATYDYLTKYSGPFARYFGLQIDVLGAPWRTKHYSADLETYCMEHRMLPGTWVRWCTDRYKVRPIIRFLRKEMDATAAAPVESWIGISTDEAARRAKRESGSPYQVNRYPLVEMGIDRKACEQIIVAAELPIPPKSGCWFCPFMKQAQWHQLKREQPDLFQRAVAMEKNARGKDGSSKYLCMFGSLDRIALQDEMVGFDAAIEAEGDCVTGSCFV